MNKNDTVKNLKKTSLRISALALNAYVGSVFGRFAYHGIGADLSDFETFVRLDFLVSMLRVGPVASIWSLIAFVASIVSCGLFIKYGKWYFFVTNSLCFALLAFAVLYAFKTYAQ